MGQDDEQPCGEFLEEARKKMESLLESPAVDHSKPVVPGKSITEPRETGGSCTGCGSGLFLGGSFLLAGSLIVLIYAADPLLSWMGASSWPATDCVIVHSGFVMEYTYTWEGTEYTSNDYDFASDYTHLGFSESERFVEGESARCFVNPDAPREAILSKAFNMAYLKGLFGLPFALAGLVMLVLFVRPALVGMRDWVTGD